MSFATTVPCEVALSFLYSKELGVPKKHLSQNHCKMAIPCGCSSVGRAQRCQRCCRGFESHHPLFGSTAFRHVRLVVLTGFGEAVARQSSPA